MDNLIHNRRWTLGSPAGFNVGLVYQGPTSGVLAVHGLPSHTETSDPCLADPRWADALAIGRLAATAPEMRLVLLHFLHQAGVDLPGFVPTLNPTQLTAYAAHLVHQQDQKGPA